jgi:hypothetical protein
VNIQFLKEPPTRSQLDTIHTQTSF